MERQAVRVNGEYYCDACDRPLKFEQATRKREDTGEEYQLCMVCYVLERHGLIFILEMPDGTIKVQKV